MIAKATESARKSDIWIASALTESAVVSSARPTGRGSHTECEMDALFETGTGFAKRKETGSRFLLNTTPMEFAKYNCFYENPIYGLNIGILAIFTSEMFALKSLNYGHVIRQPVTTGIILERGRLKADVEQQLGPRIPTTTVEAIINDVYELAVELFMDGYPGIYDLRAAGVKIHIYEAETRKFHDAFWATREGAGPGAEIIANVQAERVF
jgi:hypothetical protein